MSWLPASKEEIKKALLWQLRNNSELKDQITTCYLLLRKFQPDVGKFVPSLGSMLYQATENILGLDRKTIEDSNGDILASFLKNDHEKCLALAEKISGLFESHASFMKPWDPIIKREQAQLEQELIDLGYLPEDFHEQVNEHVKKIEKALEIEGVFQFEQAPKSIPEQSEVSFWESSTWQYIKYLLLSLVLLGALLRNL